MADIAFEKDLSVAETGIGGLKVIDLAVHGDSRGWFKENWQRAKMTALGIPDLRGVQNNISYNDSRGVTRGIHAEPWDKFISVARGSVFGAWVDLREGSAAAADGNARAELAINMFVCSIVRFIGAYYAELGGLDQLVFTGGIGENSDLVRSRVCAQIRHLGVELDEEKNSGCREGTISSAASAVRVSVIPANEELGVARQTYGYIEKMEG